MSEASPEKMAKAFALIEAAAVAGERCPMGQPRGPIINTALTALYDAGMVRSETYGDHWRVMIVLTGPNAGARTAPPPNPRWRLTKSCPDGRRMRRRQPRDASIRHAPIVTDFELVDGVYTRRVCG